MGVCSRCRSERETGYTMEWRTAEGKKEIYETDEPMCAICMQIDMLKEIRGGSENDDETEQKSSHAPV